MTIRQVLNEFIVILRGTDGFLDIEGSAVRV